MSTLIHQGLKGPGSHFNLELGGANTIDNLWPQPYDGEWNAHDNGSPKLIELATERGRQWQIG